MYFKRVTGVGNVWLHSKQNKDKEAGRELSVADIETDIVDRDIGRKGRRGGRRE
jgi:hypothetical protein